MDADEKPDATPFEVEDIRMTRRRLLQRAGGLTIATGASALSLASTARAARKPGCSAWRQPTDADFVRIAGTDKVRFLDAVLTVLEDGVVPKTMAGVRAGNKLFGAAILNKSDFSTVITATNTETDNPLFHGEVTAIFQFYDLPKNHRPSPGETIFLATHEPCPLCLSSITWGGWDNFFYLFSYEDSRDAYGIPHDVVMLDEIFRCPDGSYSEKNRFWSSWGLRDLVKSLPESARAGFAERIEALQMKYAQMSDIYQRAKAAGTGADVPLK